MTAAEAEQWARSQGCSAEWWQDVYGHRGSPAVLVVWYGAVVLLALAGPVVAAMEGEAFARLLRQGRLAMEVGDGDRSQCR